ALEAVDAGQDGVAASADGRHAAARTVDQVDERNPVVVGQVFDEAALPALAAVAAPGRTAAHGKGLAPAPGPPPLDSGACPPPPHPPRGPSRRGRPLRGTCRCPPARRCARGW